MYIYVYVCIICVCVCVFAFFGCPTKGWFKGTMGPVCFQPKKHHQGNLGYGPRTPPETLGGGSLINSPKTPKRIRPVELLLSTFGKSFLVMAPEVIVSAISGFFGQRSSSFLWTPWVHSHSLSKLFKPKRSKCRQLSRLFQISAHPGVHHQLPAEQVARSGVLVVIQASPKPRRAPSSGHGETGDQNGCGHEPQMWILGL